MATFEAKIVPYHASAGTTFYQIRVIAGHELEGT